MQLPYVKCNLCPTEGKPDTTWLKVGGVANNSTSGSPALTSRALDICPACYAANKAVYDSLIAATVAAQPAAAAPPTRQAQFSHPVSAPAALTK